MPLEGVVWSAPFAGEINGSIAVLPQGETKGPAANGLIKAGIYKSTEANGPVSGTHHVLIDVESVRGKMEDSTGQALLQWKFKFNIDVPSGGPFRSDFELIRNAKR